MNALTNIRPFQLILLVVFGLFALVGLFLFANYSGSASGTSKVGTVVIWGTLPQKAMSDELASLTTLDKAYGKVTYVQKPVATFGEDLDSAIAAGNGPDMIIIDQEQLLEEADKITVIPFSAISQRDFLSNYLPEDQLFVSTNGVFGIPFTVDPLVLYDNQTTLASAGIAEPPKTWEAVTGLAPSLTHLNQDQTIAESAIALGEYSNIMNARAILSLLFFQAGSLITQPSSTGIRSVLAAAGTQTTAINGSSPAVSALNFYTQFSDPSRTVYTWNPSFSSDEQQFIAGTLAMYVGFASEAPELKAANPNLDFDMAQIPQLQTATHATDYGNAYAFAIPKASANPKGAYSSALALTAKNVLPAAAQELSMAPAQRALLQPSATDIYGPIFYPEALIAQGWLSPPPSDIDTIFSAMITNITSGRYQPQDALSAADESLDAALPQTN